MINFSFTQLQVAKFLSDEWRPKHELPADIQKIVSDYCGTRADRFARKTIEYKRKGRMFAARKRAYEAAQAATSAAPQTAGAGKQKKRGKKQKKKGKKGHPGKKDFDLDKTDAKNEKAALPEGRNLVQY